MMKNYKELKYIKINLKFGICLFSPKKQRKLWQDVLSVQFGINNLKHTILYMICRQTGLPF